MANKKYNIIYADCPWNYADKGCQGTMANHYKGMDLEEIKKLPVGNLAEEDCVLFMWATYPMLKEALAVIEAWGFKYKSIAFQWIKLNKKGKGYFCGLGRWTRGNTECCLLATKGKPKRISASVFQIIEQPLTKHSEKPQEARDKIIKLIGDLPRIELFARQKIEGWDCWGNEVNSDIKLEVKQEAMQSEARHSSQA
jgi:site-specific DNA-methyltransferase (adenine-specific)